MELRNFVGGGYVDSVDGQRSDLVDPCTGEVFGTAPVSTTEDIDRAMKAAAGAFETWRETTPSERQRALLRFADAGEARAVEVSDAAPPSPGAPRAPAGRPASSAPSSNGAARRRS